MLNHPSQNIKNHGGGRNITIPDVWQELFEWFVDVDGTLRAQL